MPGTRTQARDDILTLVKSISDKFPDLTMIYDDSREDIPDAEQIPLTSWARVIIQHGPGGQTGLTNHDGVRRYTKTGLLTIQLFEPSTDGLQLADSVSDAFETEISPASTSIGVWFRNVRSNEVGNDGPWFQTNVIAEFTYDHVR